LWVDLIPCVTNDERHGALSVAGDPLVNRACGVEFEAFHAAVDRVLRPGHRGKGRRPPFDAVLTFKALVLQGLYIFVRRPGRVSDSCLPVIHAVSRPGAARKTVPDAKTIWLPNLSVHAVGLARATIKIGLA